MLMGFILHFYIIFGTNLLTGGPTQNCCFFAYFSVSDKQNIKRNNIFGNMIFSLNVIQETWTLHQDINQEAMRYGRAYPPGRALHPRGPLVAPPTYLFLLYKTTYPPNI